MRIIHRDAHALEELKKLESYFVEELNVREVVYDPKEEDSLSFSSKANFPRLGPRLGKKMKEVAGAIQKLSPDQLRALEEGQTLTIAGETISADDVEIRRAPKNPDAVLSAHHLVAIELDPTVTREQKVEGLSREVLRRVQVARKNANLKLDDRIRLTLAVAGDLLEACEAHKSLFEREALAADLKFVEAPQGDFVEQADIDGDAVGVGISVVR
jgi:isoleucyl-tRNA synthetase